MKVCRLMFVLLLATLLPLRAAVAVAMLCPMGHGQVQAQVAMAPAHTSCEHGGQPSPAGESCNLCAFFCSLTPITNGLPFLPLPLGGAAAAAFPELPAPVRSFMPNGLERPPRSP